MSFRKHFSIASLAWLPLASIAYLPSVWAAVDSDEIARIIEGKTKKQALADVADKYIASRFAGVQLKNASSDSLGYKTTRVSSNVSEFGPMVASYKQHFDGIPVYGKSVSVLLDKNYSLVKLEGELTRAPVLNYVPLYLDPKASAEEALKTAYATLGIDATVNSDEKASSSFQGRSQQRQKSMPHFHRFSVSFDHENLSPFDIVRPAVNKIWFAHQGFLVPAFQVAFSVKDKTKDNLVVSHTVIVSEKPQDEASVQRVLDAQSFSLRSPHTYRTFADGNTGSPFSKPYLGPFLNPYPLIGETYSSSLGRYPLSFAPESINLVTTANGPREITEPRPWHYEGFPDTYGINTVVLSNFEGYFTPGDIASINFQDERLFDEVVSSIVEADTGLTFDKTYDPTNPASRSSRDAAAVYAFYLTNWLHDYFYDFGFDEASGNGQAINYTGEGFDGDPLIVLTQSEDFVAQLVPMQDGISSVMLMPYLTPRHDDDSTFVETTINGEVSRLDDADAIGLGPYGFSDVKGALVNVPVSLNGADCVIDPSIGDLSGKIALITERCDGKQILNALSLRGVTGVLAIGQSDVSSSNENLSQTQLPPVLILRSSSVNTLIEQLEQGASIDIEMFKETIYPVDYSVETSTVVHEWTHYMVTRLAGERVGGLNGFQGVSLNEGWADFVAIYFNIHEEDVFIPGNEYYQGVYSLGTFSRPDTVFVGDRRIPYTTDTNLNAATFKNISTALPFEFDHEVENGNTSPFHGPGEIWATTLLEVYTGLLNDTSRLSFDEARRRMGHYIVNGLKLTPALPTFTDARDALLAVAYATDEQDFELMKLAFAKRGMGAGAISPPGDGGFRHLGVVESFKVNAAAFAITGARITPEVDFESLDPTLREDRALQPFKRMSDIRNCPKDGIQDKFEYGEVVFTVENRGNIDAQTVVKIESSNPFISFPNRGFFSTDVLSPIKTANDKQEFRVPFFVIASQQQEDVTFTLDFAYQESDVTYSDPVGLQELFNFDLLDDGIRTIETFDSDVSLLDWTVDIERPSVEQADYREARDSVSIQPFWGDNNMLVIESLGFVSDVNVTSNVITVSDDQDFALSFNASWSYEIFLGTALDGLFMEVSVDGGPWTNVIEQGGVFSQGGYNGQLEVVARYVDADGNAVFDAPEPAFVGSSDNQFDGDGNLASVTRLEFGRSLAGKKVQVRFHSRSDNTNNLLGLQLDNLSIEGASNTGLRSIVDNSIFCRSSRSFIRNKTDKRSPSAKSYFNSTYFK